MSPLSNKPDSEIVSTEEVKDMWQGVMRVNNDIKARLKESRSITRIKREPTIEELREAKRIREEILDWNGANR